MGYFVVFSLGCSTVRSDIGNGIHGIATAIQDDMETTGRNGTRDTRMELSLFQTTSTNSTTTTTATARPTKPTTKTTHQTVNVVVTDNGMDFYQSNILHHGWSSSNTTTTTSTTSHGHESYPSLLLLD